jgi:hypothetical protein
LECAAPAEGAPPAAKSAKLQGDEDKKARGRRSRAAGAARARG